MDKLLFLILFLVIVLPFGSLHICSIDRQKKIVDCSKLNLTTVPDDLPANIKVLNLSENIISNISNNSFGNYSHLVSLNLNRNKIQFVDPHGFYGLENLQKLTVMGNFLNVSNHEGIRILKNIPNITELDFSRQNMYSHANESNFKGYMKYPDIEFQHLNRLRNLSLDLYGYPVFGPGFKNLKLHSLRFRQCNIRLLQNKTFQNFPDSVREIYLTKCKLIDVEKIENGLFIPIPNLTTLDLSWTKISLIKGLELLYPLRNNKMDTINLGHMKNSWTNRTLIPYAITLTPGMMQHLNTICVKTLVLADNNIVDILPNSLFASRNLSCLEYIDLSGNRFGFSSFSFNELFVLGQRLYNLKTFDFSYLPIHFVNERYLEFPTTKIKPYIKPSTKKTDIEYCAKLKRKAFGIFLPKSIEYVRITHVMGAPDLYGLVLYNASSLTHVDMSYYQLKCFPDITFGNSDNNLEFLDISGIECWHYYNKTSIPVFYRLKTLVMREVEFYQAINDNKNVLKYSPNLEYLDLSWNGLWTIPQDYLTHLKNMTHLMLSNNHFRRIPDDVTRLPKLVLLDMTDNRLFTVYSNFTSWFDLQLRNHGKFTLKLHLNDFDCSCEHTDFIRWLSVTKVKLDKTKNYKCRLENGSNTKTDDVIEHFHAYFDDCEAIVWLRVGIVLVVSFFAVFLPAAILFNFRWRIAFLCYRKFRKIVEGSMNLTYDYDVYVSYGYNGYPWVREFLVKQLETKWGLKVCLEDRDFINGRSNYEQIADAIDKSRHIIFVVTSDFMSKPFAVYEIDRVKVAKSVYTLQKVLVISVDLSVEDVPTELQSIWSDVSLIEWPKDEVDTKSTLDKLRTKVVLNF